MRPAIMLYSNSISVVNTAGQVETEKAVRDMNQMAMSSSSKSCKRYEPNGNE